MLEFKAKFIRSALTSEGTHEITFAIEKGLETILDGLTALKNPFLTVKEYRAKRSKDANAYFWKLCDQQAKKLSLPKATVTKDDVYLQMLDRYGVCTYIVVKENVVERVKQEWRAVRELGEVTINGKQGIQLQCYFGSSTYDTKEMSRLIDGIVSECKEQGIETATPQELSLLKSEWGK